MKTQFWLAFLLVFLLAFLGPELYAVVTGEVTFSQAVAIWNDRFPIISYVTCFAFGVLVGHWFWPLRVINERQTTDTN